MNKNRVFELRGDPDKYPGFLQSFDNDTIDPAGWKEVIAVRCISLGAKPFGDSYVPIPLELSTESKRMRGAVGDICLSMQPFIILSEKSRIVLGSFLHHAGEFLEVSAPLQGYIGYRVLTRIDDCIDFHLSKYIKYDNGAIAVRKAAMYRSKVAAADIFCVPEAPSSIFVSEAFKDAVVKAKLKGFDMGREIPLTS